MLPIQFVLPANVAVAQLHIHHVEYSAMCNCALQEVQTGMETTSKATLRYFLVIIFNAAWCNSCRQ